MLSSGVYGIEEIAAVGVMTLTSLEGELAVYPFEISPAVSPQHSALYP